MSESSLKSAPSEINTATVERANRIEEQPLFDFEELKQTLAEHVETMQKQFKVKHRNLLRWAKKQGYTMHFLADAGSKVAVTGGLIGSLLAGVPQQIAGLPEQPTAYTETAETKVDQVSLTKAPESKAAARQKDQITAKAIRDKQLAQQQQFMQQLQQLSIASLDRASSAAAAEIVTNLTGVPATDQLEGFRLNTNNGRIGAEQHLYRYPGDNATDHFETNADRLEHYDSGFAPGLGAYGYFAPSAAAMTPEIAAKERYYVAVQTFLSPNWVGNVNQTYNWFKHRKVIVYHPVTQKAVVAVVGDAGPALSTGKNYGGSPEVMHALGAFDGYGTPPVLMFFVEDDPEDPTPLGPVDFKLPPLE